jgi:cytochrome c oxidase cbb3-type subunit 1
MGGVLFLSGMLIMAYNVWKTVAGKQAIDAPIPQIVPTAAAVHT